MEVFRYSTGVPIKIGDVVRVPHALGEWLVDYLNEADGTVGLLGEPGKYIWESPRWVTFSCELSRMPWPYAAHWDERMRVGVSASGLV
jgi:hypothetical protein